MNQSYLFTNTVSSAKFYTLNSKLLLMRALDFLKTLDVSDFFKSPGMLSTDVGNLVYSLKVPQVPQTSVVWLRIPICPEDLCAGP